MLSYDTISLHPQGTPGGMLFTKTEDVVLTTSRAGNMVMEEYRALGTFTAENKTELSVHLQMYSNIIGCGAVLAPG